MSRDLQINSQVNALRARTKYKIASLRINMKQHIFDNLKALFTAEQLNMPMISILENIIEGDKQEQIKERFINASDPDLTNYSFLDSKPTDKESANSDKESVINDRETTLPCAIRIEDSILSSITGEQSNCLGIVKRKRRTPKEMAAYRATMEIKKRAKADNTRNKRKQSTKVTTQVLNEVTSQVFSEVNTRVLNEVDAQVNNKPASNANATPSANTTPTTTTTNSTPPNATNSTLITSEETRVKHKGGRPRKLTIAIKTNPVLIPASEISDFDFLPKKLPGLRRYNRDEDSSVILGIKKRNK